MKVISKLALAFVIAFSSAANAGFSNQYVASRLSYVDMKYRDTQTKQKISDSLSALSIAYGFNVVPKLRLEAELNVHSSKDDNTEVDFRNVGYYYYRDDTITTFTSMLNVYYDFVNSSRFTPFVMAGIGLSSIGYDYEKTEITPAGRYYHYEDDDSKTHFAYQAGLGLAFKINNHFTADLMYKYADLGDFKFSWNFDRIEQSEQLVSAGVRYSF